LTENLNEIFAVLAASFLELAKKQQINEQSCNSGSVGGFHGVSVHQGISCKN
jgi:hypothetical protein